MQELQRALRVKRRKERKFNGTVSAASKLMNDVGHQTLRNLVEGRTRPWRIMVHTKNEILRVLGPYGLEETHFEQPRDEP